MDGDSRGGAALSVHEVSGKPIKFVGTGERLEALEPFYPDRLAGRILGMGATLEAANQLPAPSCRAFTGTPNVRIADDALAGGMDLWLFYAPPSSSGRIQEPCAACKL